MSKKIGVYICTGCGIEDVMDIDVLEEAADDNGAKVCQTNSFLCGSEGVEMIQKDLDEAGIDTVVIAACSGRVNYDVFNFGSDKIVERANIREQVAWVHEADEPDDDEENHTALHAADVITMAITKVKDMKLVEPYQAENVSKTILIVGGGMAGLTATLEAAKAGYQTVLVEKEANLGGWLNKLHKLTPLGAPYTGLVDPDVDARVKELEEHPNVTIHTAAKIKKTIGAPGMFDVVIAAGNEIIERASARGNDG